MPASSSGVQTVGIGQHERASSFCIVEPAGRNAVGANSAFRAFGFVGGSWITIVVIARLEPFSTIHRVGYHVVVSTGIDATLAITILVTVFDKAAPGRGNSIYAGSPRSGRRAAEAS